VLGTVLAALFSAFIIGGLARWAVPGPDPMPIWLTILFGLGGWLIGLAVSVAVIGHTGHATRGDYFAIVLSSIVSASVLIILYRRYVQGRPITGPEAHKLPQKGVGISQVRRRLRQMGIDPDSIGTPRGPSPMRTGAGAAGGAKADLLQKLDELHDEGLLSDEEYVEKRAQVLRREA
jgi:uncharacterized membrane protein YeaQ/YmgE (transglycosylase-associated protein family)